MITNLLKVSALFLFTVIITLWASCSLFDNSVSIPSYIHISKINLIPTDTVLQGTASTNIADAWVYIDDQPLGAYPLPATFPVLYEGTHRIKVGAGIKMNGISNTRIPYPFYTFYEGTVTLTPKQVSPVSPGVKYFSGITFSMIEDFEGAGYCLVDSFGASRLRTVTGAQAWGGGKSVLTKLSGDTITFQARTCTTYALTADGRAKFIELNYKCNHSFVVGLVYSGGTAPVLGINPSASWNKIYINVTDQILISGSYGIYIAMQRLGSDVTDPELYLDNLKLIHN